jgi:branched-subunit amino acid transport protein
MSTTDWIVVVAGLAAGSYALRVSPFLWTRLRRLGEKHFRFLSYVSIAIAAGIVSRSVTYAGESIAAPMDVGIKVIAILAGFVFLRLTRIVPVALFAGVGLAVLLKSLAQ